MINQYTIIMGLYIILGIFEFKFPAEKNQTSSGRIRNIFYTLFLLFTGIFTVGLIYKLLFMFLPQARHLPDHGVLFSVWITMAYLFLIDLGFYWYHRAEHKFAVLWQIHELHHSDRELNSTSSMRTYWLELPLQTLLISIPVSYIIGINDGAGIMLLFAVTGMLFFTHANWRLRLGWFTRIICGPQVHRIHHSRLPEHHNKNFAQYFPFIDIIFGTYYHPQYNEFPSTGLDELPTDVPVETVMVRPFKNWWVMLTSKFY